MVNAVGAGEPVIVKTHVEAESVFLPEHVPVDFRLVGGLRGSGGGRCRAESDHVVDFEARLYELFTDKRCATRAKTKLLITMRRSWE